MDKSEGAKEGELLLKVQLGLKVGNRGNSGKNV